MGCVLLFDIPVALTLLKKEDRPVLACGILVGVITVPLGCLAGGLVMNLTTEYHMDFLTMLLAVLPVILVAAALGGGPLVQACGPDDRIFEIRRFCYRTHCIFVALAVFQYETGIRFPLLYQMVEPTANSVSPLAQSVEILGDIAFVLLGAFPMVEWIKRHFGGALAKVGSRLGMNEAGLRRIVATLANNIPTFKMVQDMDPKANC